MEKLLLAQGLSAKQIKDIQELEAECCKNENLSMKLNLDMLEKRPVEEVNDFLYYIDDKIIGFLGLYSFGKKPMEIEITGMVHPEHRRKGVFKNLFTAAKQECEVLGAARILLITERLSDAGTSFVKSIDSQYSFSEYRMNFDAMNVPDYPKHGLTLRKANPDDVPDIIHLDSICFGLPKEDVSEKYSNNTCESIFIVELNSKTIGKIGVSHEGESGYIFGFGIIPEYRGCGYGREALSLTLERLLSAKYKTVILEVAVKNENALSLYKSCGFKEATIYDYYEILL